MSIVYKQPTITIVLLWLKNLDLVAYLASKFGNMRGFWLTSYTLAMYKHAGKVQSNLGVESQMTTCGTHGRDRVNQDHQIAPFQSQLTRTDVV